MPRKKKEVIVEDDPTRFAIKAPSEKDGLMELHARLVELNVHSISDLENLIARAE